MSASHKMGQPFTKEFLEEIVKEEIEMEDAYFAYQRRLLKFERTMEEEDTTLIIYAPHFLGEDNLVHAGPNSLFDEQGNIYDTYGGINRDICDYFKLDGKTFIVARNLEDTKTTVYDREGNSDYFGGPHDFISSLHYVGDTLLLSAFDNDFFKLVDIDGKDDYFGGPHKDVYNFELEFQGFFGAQEVLDIFKRDESMYNVIKNVEFESEDEKIAVDQYKKTVKTLKGKSILEVYNFYKERASGVDTFITFAENKASLLFETIKDKELLIASKDGSKVQVWDFEGNNYYNKEGFVDFPIMMNINGRIGMCQDSEKGNSRNIYWEDGTSLDKQNIILEKSANKLSNIDYEMIKKWVNDNSSNIGKYFPECLNEIRKALYIDKEHEKFDVNPYQYLDIIKDLLENKFIFNDWRNFIHAIKVPYRSFEQQKKDSKSISRFINRPEHYETEKNLTEIFSLNDTVKGMLLANNSQARTCVIGYFNSMDRGGRKNISIEELTDIANVGFFSDNENMMIREKIGEGHTSNFFRITEYINADLPYYKSEIEYAVKVFKSVDQITNQKAKLLFQDYSSNNKSLGKKENSLINSFNDAAESDNRSKHVVKLLRFEEIRVDGPVCEMDAYGNQIAVETYDASKRLPENAPNKYALFFEFIKGHNFRELVNENGSLGIEDVKLYFSQFLKGMGYIHSNEILHRDIKPENIMVETESGIVKIVDFGVASKLGSELRNVGSDFYRAPETFNGIFDYKSDIWSSGNLLYFMNAGEDLVNLPREKIKSALMSDMWHSEKEARINETTHPLIAPVIIKSTKMNPEERYQSTERMSAAFNRRLKI